MSGLWVESESAPAVVPCFAYGQAPIFRATSELPPSIERAVDLFRGPYEDCVKGFTVGPGEAKPTLPAVREYLVKSLEQGWVVQGELYETLGKLLMEAEEAIEAHPDDTLVVLERLLGDVESAMAAHQASMAPEVDALIRMNVEVMKNLAKE